ncbi:MAG: hypothetical protein J4F34_02050 [Gemmatimonadetes bacterium]|nr:hypothetical protein [Gemmatimonadota bacterium]
MKTVGYSRIRFLSLFTVPILTAAPLGAQSVIGFRAGVAWARTDYSHVHFAPCPPETACHGVPSDRILTPLISADVRHPTAVEELSFRLSLSYGVKGGTGSGYWADHATPSSGTLRLHFLQFSPLLNVNLRGQAQDRYAVSLLVGPWAALRIGCSVAGQLGTSCESSEPVDAGVAFGGGVQYRVASNLTLAAESIYHWGILPQNVSGVTRLVAVQFGVTIHSR